MRKKNYKGKCEKRKLEKFEGVCKTYDPIQYAYADVLSKCEDIEKIRCNVPLDDTECMSDFVCTKNNGDIMVRECVYRKHLAKPQTISLLDMSQKYWLQHGVTDWGLVIDAAEE